MTLDELARWFDHVREVLSAAYLSHEEPWRQSGMSGPQERWATLRRPVADCMDHSGTFLDIGCANDHITQYQRGTSCRIQHIHTA